MIATACPNCGKKFNLGDEVAGKKAKCACGSVFTIRSAASPTVTTPIKVVLPPEIKEVEPAAGRPPSRTFSPAGAVAQVLRHPFVVSAVQDVRERYVVASKTKHFRSVSIVGAAALLLLCIFAYEVHRYRANAREQLLRQIDENYRHMTASAEQLRERGDADIEEAHRLRERAAEVRDTPSAVDTPEPSRRLTRSEAIDGDAFIGAVIDRFPDLRSMIMSGGTALDVRLDLLVSAGSLGPSDVSYIRRFSSQLQTLPQ